MTISDLGLADPSGVTSQAKHPLFTIAIPTFNRASLLKECIEAAFSQTYSNFEVVVSNNNSSDDTEKVLSTFSDPRLRVIKQETNIGLLPNWNACVSAANGDYVVIVSDDDRISPWFLERCSLLLEVRPTLPIIVTLSSLYAGSLGCTKPPRVSEKYKTGIWEGIDILTEFLTDRITVTMCSVMMRTDLLRARGGIPLDLPHVADVAAWAPMLFLGKAGLVNEACATFTFHDQSETARLGVEKLLLDGRRMTDLIKSTADAYISNSATRKYIVAQARACFARRGLIVLSDFRYSGGAVNAILGVFWRYRSEFHGIDLKALVRFGVVILCPPRFTARLRRLGHATRGSA